MQTKKIISVSILLAILVFAGFYVRSNLSDFKQLRIIYPEYLVIAAVLLILIYILIGQQTKYLIMPFGARLQDKEAFQLAVITGFYNIITPFKGGMAARAVYLKKKFKFSYMDFLATLSASYILIFLVSCISGIIALFFIYFQRGVFSFTAFLLFLGFSLFLGSIAVFSPNIPQTRYSIINKLIRVVNGWHLIRKQTETLKILFFLSLAQLFVQSISILFAFEVFGISISFAEGLFLICLSSLGLLISITPAGLGVTEAVAVFSGIAIGIAPVQSLAVAILYRAVSFVVLLVLGPIYSYQLLKNVKV